LRRVKPPRAVSTQWVLEPQAQVIANQVSKIAGAAEECLSFFPNYEKAIAN
jgi:hypothetical protein